MKAGDWSGQILSDSSHKRASTAKNLVGLITAFLMVFPFIDYPRSSISAGSSSQRRTQRSLKTEELSSSQATSFEEMAPGGFIALPTSECWSRSPSVAKSIWSSSPTLRTAVTTCRWEEGWEKSLAFGVLHWLCSVLQAMFRLPKPRLGQCQSPARCWTYPLPEESASSVSHTGTLVVHASSKTSWATRISTTSQNTYTFQTHICIHICVTDEYLI